MITHYICNVERMKIVTYATKTYTLPTLPLLLINNDIINNLNYRIMKAITKESLIGKVSSLLNKRLKYDRSNDRYYFMKSDIDGFVDKGDISVDIDLCAFGNVVCAIEIIFKKLDRWFVIHLFDNGTISMQENKDSGDIVDYFTYSTDLDDITNILAMNNNNKDKDMKAKKSGVKAEKVEEDKEVKAVTVEGLEIVDYSEKSIAVFGDTKAVKDLLKELGGRFNPALKYNGEKRSGWIFGKKQADKVKELITPTELPALSKEIYIPELAKETEQPKTLEKSSIRNNLKTLDHSLYDDYEAGLLNLEECARKFAKSGWTNFVDIEYTKEVFDRIEKQTYPTKEEAEKEAERLNGFTDCNGRLRRII